MIQKNTVDPTPVDPLSEALSAMHMESSLLAIFNLPGLWSVAHPRKGGVVCHIVAEGTCFCNPAEGPTIELGRGDLIAFPHGDPHTLASSPGLKGTPIAPLLDAIGHPVWTPQNQYPRPVRYWGNGPGARTLVIDLVSAFPVPNRNLLLRALPSVMHIRAEHLKVRSWLDFALDMVASEPPKGTPGYAAAVSRMTDLIFIQAVRTHLSIQAADARGWLRGLFHPRISRALQAIHHDPQRNWTVAQLATEAGMSRTPFALEFTACLELSPIRYLTEWRMHLASRRLAEGVPISVVADELGYASPISFARTFRRVMGITPGGYRRGVTREDAIEAKPGTPHAQLN
ncbi:cupin domain-containing protein [Rhodoplanes roseus]|uniref:HTH araC/xylS-type domain-containing protein n=1 Tax=Rhodoplanes roseus TaxID=29409 RepID=A0A327L1X2_9BRAD|nr:cupin domain-containing protein [Rhodoplanes roseus]RAI44367.1 hypothetical protein CH341_09435 [Rhodoplanes roseus]